MRPLLLVLLLAATPAPAQPLADEPPPCDASRQGSLSCQVGRACVCRHEQGGSLTGRPGGFRWDCGILRPACPPAAMQGPPTAWPPGLPMPQLWLERDWPPPGRPPR